MANRRKFIAGLGALATGSAAAMGTGAFSSAQADRTVDIDVVGDSSAYLALSEGSNTDVAEDVVTESSGTVSLNFDGSNTDAGGLNQNASTAFHNILNVTNQGTTEVIFGVDTTALNNESWIDDFNVYAHGDDGSPEYDGTYFNTNGGYPAGVSSGPGSTDPLVDLTAGEGPVSLSVDIDTNDEEKSNGSVTLPFIAVEKGGRNDNTQGTHFGE